jgi:hypothetical protein
MLILQVNKRDATSVRIAHRMQMDNELLATAYLRRRLASLASGLIFEIANQSIPCAPLVRLAR